MRISCAKTRFRRVVFAFIIVSVINAEIRRTNRSLKKRPHAGRRRNVVIEKAETLATRHQLEVLLVQPGEFTHQIFQGRIYDVMNRSPCYFSAKQRITELHLQH